MNNAAGTTIVAAALVSHSETVAGHVQAGDVAGLTRAFAALNDVETTLEQMRREIVRALREGGASWATVGAAIGTSRQAAQQRYGMYFV